MEVPTLARRSFPSKRMVKVGLTRKEWRRGIRLKIQLSGSLVRLGRLFPYPNNRFKKRGSESLKLCQNKVSGPGIQKNGMDEPDTLVTTY